MFKLKDYGDKKGRLKMPDRTVLDCLKNPEYERIALYLPFEDMEEFTPTECRAYRQAYLHLLGEVDFRETFVKGDIPELSCRTGEPEKIIKALHLVPWVISSDIFTFEELLAEVEAYGHPLCAYSFLDGVTAAYLLDIVTDTEFAKAQDYVSKFPPREQDCVVTHISDNRRIWLEGQKAEPARPTEILRDLAHPSQYYTDDLDELIDYTMDSAPVTHPDDRKNYLYVFGGSRLKGYSLEDSDLDFFIWDARTQSFLGEPSRPKEAIAHLYLNYKGIYYERAKEANKAYKQCVEELYMLETDPASRRASVKRLELDLCCYRLLHKGFARFYPDDSPDYKMLRMIDGHTPFYETSYRKVATELYLEKVFIPNHSNATNLA